MAETTPKGNGERMRELVYCTRCQKTHAVQPGETPCPDGQWSYECMQEFKPVEAVESDPQVSRGIRSAAESVIQVHDENDWATVLGEGELANAIQLLRDELSAHERQAVITHQERTT